jgi:DNA repair protein RadD
MQLRGYQERAIDALRSAFQSGARAPLLCLPTGGGKTVILATIAAQAAARGRQVLILVHRRELIHQTASKLHGLGWITASSPRAIPHPITGCRSHRCKRSCGAYPAWHGSHRW